MLADSSSFNLHKGVLFVNFFKGCGDATEFRIVNSQYKIHSQLIKKCHCLSLQFISLPFTFCTSAAGNSLNYNNGRAFTTRDRDNDASSYNCATYNFNLCGSGCNVNAGWWYYYCGNSLLNSPYGSTCFYWYCLPGSRCNIKYTEMKVRPI